MSIARGNSGKISQFWTLFQAQSQRPVSSRFFRTRSTGAKFKSVPVRNWLHITPISRIEWTLARYALSRQFKPNEINHSTSHVANWLGRKPRYMQYVAIHQKQPIYYLNFLRSEMRHFRVSYSFNRNVLKLYPKADKA